jgi:DNA-binding transcriptional regulator YdaS (Cro superfamily)
LINSLRQAVKKSGQRAMANKIGISRSTLSELFLTKMSDIPPKLNSAINRAISELNTESKMQEIQNIELLGKAQLEIGQIGLGEFAAAVGIDPSNLSKVINGRRKVGGKLLGQIMEYFSRHKN